MNSIISKIIAVIIAVFLLVYVVYQSYESFYNPYVAETVSLGDYIESVDLSGFFIRSESQIDVVKSGAIYYNYRNAQKISNGVEIAKIYNSETDLYNLHQIEMLKKEKSVLERAANSEDIEGIKLDLLNRQISNYKAEIVRKIDEEDLTSIEDSYLNLMYSMNKGNKYINRDLSFDDAIAELDMKITLLEQNLPEQTETVVSGNSGYFSNVTDGLESVLSFESLDDMTVDKALTLIEQKPVSQTQSIGKLVNESYWYFAAVVPVSELEGISKAYHSNSGVKLKFNSKSTREVPAEITDIIEEKDNGNAVVVFKSNYMDEDLINMRFESPSVILGIHTGIIIPKEAIRLVDGEPAEVISSQLSEIVELEEKENEERVLETAADTDKAETTRQKGLYIMYGKEAKFRLVDVVYEDDYVVVSRINEKTSYVSSYDKVIIKGKDLNGN